MTTHECHASDEAIHLAIDYAHSLLWRYLLLLVMRYNMAATLSEEYIPIFFRFGICRAGHHVTSPHDLLGNTYTASCDPATTETFEGRGYMLGEIHGK